MADAPKCVLLQLEGLEMEAFPEPVLELLGIQQGGIVEVQVPRFPRVGDVKLAASRALGIPVKDQVLRGPLPSLAEISCDWAHLWELEILPGLSDPTSAKGEHKLQTVKRTLAPPAAVRRDTSQAGELFTSADPIPGRVKTDGKVVSDILQLSTRRPVADYLPGGTVYQKRLRQKRFLSGAWNTLLVALVLGAAFYVLWLIPGYEMPKLPGSGPQWNQGETLHNESTVADCEGAKGWQRPEGGGSEGIAEEAAADHSKSRDEL